LIFDNLVEACRPQFVKDRRPQATLLQYIPEGRRAERMALEASEPLDRLG